MRNTYTVDIDEPEDATVCECGSCNWQGRFSELTEIESCSLTPGDPSPAGRCPECDTIAYVVTEQTRLEGAAAELNAALRLAVDFIENVADDNPERQMKFFAVREAWRVAFAKARR